MEMAMLDQGMKLICRRFQNLKTPSVRNQLENFEVSHLRPLSNLLWGYINDDGNRVSLNRRVLEYKHQYGLEVSGTAIKKMDAIDIRSTFLEQFHQFLNKLHLYYQEESNRDIKPNAYPIKYITEDLQRILQSGAHNQFSDLTIATRTDFMTIQWILSRPEMKHFINSREEIGYKEEWMGTMEALRNMQGWGNDDLNSYYECAVRGERLLLAIRYSNSITTHSMENLEEKVKNWARDIKEDVMIYTHAYLSITGVDLSKSGSSTQPATFIERKHKQLSTRK
jgi:hypothetical protein